MTNPETTPSKPTQPPAADDYCPACHYSLAGIPDPASCPECGLALDDEAHGVRQRRESLRRRPVLRIAAAACVLPPIYALAAGMLIGDKGPFFAALIVLGATVTGTLITGELLTVLARPFDRPVVRRLWLIGTVYLHAPWLVAALFAPIGLVIGWIDSAAGLDGGLFHTVVIGGALLYPFAALTMLVLCIATLVTRSGRLRVRWSIPQILLITAAIALQFPANGFVGFMGGALAASAAERITGVESFLGDF